MRKHIKVKALLAVLALGGCAGISGKQDLSQTVFLRGQFAWWEALDEYKVKRIGRDVYVASAELTADGQPYELKFADAEWSSVNCGHLTPDDQELTIGKVSKANCSTDGSFKFTPPETGAYDFYLDVSGDVPLVYVEAGS
ncbi:hypothetical protein [Hahella ganghwensis]|uniref:hypothetical protein n=1 Tax=Hahella ganghwensis TaxID=286420 RepID=UPI0003617DC5|nr:hypothetical protein [Hahella ganghwensis]